MPLVGLEPDALVDVEPDPVVVSQGSVTVTTTVDVSSQGSEVAVAVAEEVVRVWVPEEVSEAVLELWDSEVVVDVTSEVEEVVEDVVVED